MTIASRGATMAVDWEQRVDFDRLRTDRLERTKAALEAVRARAPSCSSTRTTSATSRARRSGRGSATRTSASPSCRAAAATRCCGTSARPRATTSSTARGCRSRAGGPGCRRCAARCPTRPASRTRSPTMIVEELRERGLDKEPVGMDVPDMTTLLALQRHGHPRRRLAAGDAPCAAAQDRGRARPPRPGGRHGRRGVRGDLPHAPARASRENEIVAAAMKVLFELGSEHVEAINAISGDRCNPHPHTFADRLLRPGDQAFFDIIHSFMGYRTCYYRTFNVSYATPSQIDAYKRCREWLDAAIDLVRPGVTTDKIAEVWPTARGDRDDRRARRVRAAVRPRARRRPLRVPDDLAHALVRGPGRARGRHGLRARDVLPGHRRPLGRTDRGGGRRHARPARR